MNTTCYTYAVARTANPTAVAGLRGIDGTEVHLVRHRDIAAVVSPDVDEAALRTRLDRLDELEPIARAHHAVVAAVADRAVTAPLRLATIHRDERRVVDLLRDGYEGFRAVLDRLTGRVELGVKLYLEEQPAAGPAPAADSGRAYLRQLGQHSRRRDVEWQHAAQSAGRVDTALAALAAGSSHHRPQPAQLSGAPGRNILNAAYLVAAGRVDEFTALARRLAGSTPTLRIEVTGPWAPYSFAQPEDRGGSR